MTSIERPEPIRIGVVATDPLRVLGLQTIFSDGRTTELVPLTGHSALSSTNLSMVLVDASCTDHLFELLSSFQRARARLKVIVVGMEEQHEFIERVIGAGAKGYLSHGATADEIRMAIDIVLDGSVWAPRKVLARLLEKARKPDPALSIPKFTGREADVLRLLIAGLPNREIAHTLKIDEGTVKAHVGRLMRKVGVENRTALTVQTMSRNLLGM